MNNYRGDGNRVRWTNTGSDVASGDVVVIGAMIGVAVTDIAAGATSWLQASENVELPAKSTDTGVVGAVMYWDAGNGELTTTVGSNVYGGHLMRVKTNGQTTAVIRLASTVLTTVADGAITAAKLATDVYPVGIPLTNLRKSAAAKDDLPDAPDATELGLADTQGSLVVGTTTNGGATAAATEKAAVRVALPANYVNGEAITLRIRAKVSVSRQVGASVDAVVKKCGDSLGSDICATAAQTLSTSFANKDFTITPTGLVAGDELNIEVALASDDTGGSANGLPSISHIELRPVVRV